MESLFMESTQMRELFGHTLWICRKAIIRKNACADTVKSSRCCLFKLANASCGSFSHGSTRPGPLIRIPVEMPSITRRKQSPGLNGIPADEIIFSVNNSKAWNVYGIEIQLVISFFFKFLDEEVVFTHWLSGVQVGTRWHKSRKTRIIMTHDCRPVALAYEIWYWFWLSRKKKQNYSTFWGKVKSYLLKVNVIQ